MRSSPAWGHMIICSLMRVPLKLNSMNGKLDVFEILHTVNRKCISSCKILREATPRSLVILDGSWSWFSAVFVIDPSNQSWDAELRPM